MFASKFLKAFIYTADELSIKKAADRLSITPQATSMMIRKTEKILGLKLFSYSQGQMHLTEYGECLYRETHLHFNALQSISGKIKQKEKIQIYIEDELYFIESVIRYNLSKLNISADIYNELSIGMDMDLYISSERIDDMTILNSESLNLLLIGLTTSFHDLNTIMIDERMRKSKYISNLIKFLADEYEDIDIVFSHGIAFKVNSLCNNKTGLISSPVGVFSLMLPMLKINPLMIDVPIKININFYKRSNQSTIKDKEINSIISLVDYKLSSS